MNDVVDYALQQGDNLGVALWFIFLNLCWIIPAGIILSLLGYLVYRLLKKCTKLFLVLILLSSCAYASGQSFHQIRERNVPLVLSAELKDKINRECSKKTKSQIIDYSMKTTCDLLSFSMKNDKKIGQNRPMKANCIGYAALCNAICNYAFKINGFSCRSKQIVGHIYLGKINLCSVLSNIFVGRLSKFTKDHDAIEIGGEYYDPSLYEINKKGRYAKITTNK